MMRRLILLALAVGLCVLPVRADIGFKSGSSSGSGCEPSSNGINVRTASGTCTARSVTSSDGSLAVTNADGVSGNIDLAVDSAVFAQFTSGTADATGNCLVGTFHLRTDTDEVWHCSSTNTWTQVGTGDVTASSTTTFTNKTLDANGTGNSVSNIDVADLADGTDGQLITWDAAGAPTVVATGTADQVLTSNGAGAAPTFQDAAGGSSFDPGTTFEIYEEFASGDAQSGEIGTHGWTAIAEASGTYAQGTDVVEGNPGLRYKLASSASDDSGTHLHLVGAFATTAWTAHEWEFDAVIRIDSSAVTSYAIHVGLWKVATWINGVNDCIWAVYDTDKSHSNWVFQVADEGATGCMAAGDDTNSETEASTISPSAGNSYRVRIRRVASGVGGNPTIYFRINDETEKTFCSSGCDSTLSQTSFNSYMTPAIGCLARDTSITRECWPDYVYVKMTGLDRY